MLLFVNIFVGRSTKGTISHRVVLAVLIAEDRVSDGLALGRGLGGFGHDGDHIDHVAAGGVDIAALRVPALMRRREAFSCTPSSVQGVL